MLEEPFLHELIRNAQQGDEKSRREVIHGSKHFLEKVTSNICKRAIARTDDEMSISLIAFNEAIERYNKSQNDNFYIYARLIIQSRLIDYYRKEGRQKAAVSLNAVHSQDSNGEEYEVSLIEIKQSLQNYNEQRQVMERMEEIQLYSARLEAFGIYFEELEAVSPDRADARANLIQIAYEFVKTPELVEFLNKTKQLPVKQMLDFVHVSRKTVERGRKYLIALIVVLISDDLPHLKSSIQFPDLERRGRV
ncbi:RNA polymerase sigma factor SigI [Paenibacillus darwinianus]|uniref:sigma factor n=2 Tax=Paenibacillus darwinianus TaxID=1380763 RepID=UPI00044B6E4C|nr:sigma factor [Paenibacillus darwinianus]EXX90578.1 RNA polymerase sigma factor SigI [Paenibacillus darwinianus]